MKVGGDLEGWGGIRGWSREDERTTDERVESHYRPHPQDLEGWGDDGVGIPHACLFFLLFPCFMPVPHPHIPPHTLPPTLTFQDLSLPSLKWLNSTFNFNMYGINLICESSIQHGTLRKYYFNGHSIIIVPKATSKFFLVSSFRSFPRGSIIVALLICMWINCIYN